MSKHILLYYNNIIKPKAHKLYVIRNTPLVIYRIGVENGTSQSNIFTVYSMKFGTFFYTPQNSHIKGIFTPRTVPYVVAKYLNTHPPVQKLAQRFITCISIDLQDYNVEKLRAHFCQSMSSLFVCVCFVFTGFYQLPGTRDYQTYIYYLVGS
jgi:hypothetical protein